MALFQTKSPDEKQAREVADKLADEIARRDKNATQLRAAEAALAACRATVEQLALDGDESRLDAALEKQSIAEKKATALKAASVKIGAVIADLEKQAAVIADRRQRQMTAAEIEKIALAVERAGEAFADAAAELAAASRRAGDIVPDALPLWSYGHAAGEEAPVAVRMVCEILRHYASETLAGRGRATLPMPEVPAPKLALVPPPPMETVFLIRACKYADTSGKVILCGSHRKHSLPAKIAAKALAVNAALPLSDKRCRDLDGTRGMLVPAEAACEPLDDATAKATTEPKSASIAEPIRHSAYEIEVVDRGPAYNIVVPVRPLAEPVTAARTLAEE
jgi:hypothetical protein